MTSSSLSEFRKHFPATSKGIFTDVAQRGLIPTPVHDSITDYLTSRTDLSWNKEEAFNMVEDTRNTFASFINATPAEIAFTKNVSEGINLIAGAVSWDPGDKVILCPDLEHPANVFPWYNVCKLHGVEITAVDSSGGHFDLDRIASAIDERTRVVSVSTVSFSPGFVTDVIGLADICRQRGVRLLVDAAQSVGILHTDVQKLQVDALAVATQKGLLSCYGSGFLYCSSDFAEELRPATLARFSVAAEEGSHETTLTDQQFQYAPAPRLQRVPVRERNIGRQHRAVRRHEGALPHGQNRRIPPGRLRVGQSRHRHRARRGRRPPVDGRDAFFPAVGEPAGCPEDDPAALSGYPVGEPTHVDAP